MGLLGEYVLSVISASIIAAVVCSFFTGNSPVTGIVRVVCGLFLTFVMVSPLARLDFSGLDDYLEGLTLEGMEAAAAGEKMAREAEADIIIDGVQAYILDKAKAFGAQLGVEVILDQDNIPVSVNLKGNLSPYARARLSEIMEEDLGIAKEHQLWIG